MVLDPILRLAVAMQSSKGVYALLIGSGVSRGSGIPTGWEVIVDLVRKLAHLKGETCDPDPEAWYRSQTGGEPDYSDILDQLTLTSAERVQLLRSYFEPSEDDREQGRKAPSPAHRGGPPGRARRPAAVRSTIAALSSLSPRVEKTISQKRSWIETLVREGVL